VYTFFGPICKVYVLSVEGKAPSFTRNVLDLLANGNSIVGLAAVWLLQGGVIKIAKLVYRSLFSFIYKIALRTRVFGYFW
jgi:hypothetical protein